MSTIRIFIVKSIYHFSDIDVMIWTKWKRENTI